MQTLQKRILISQGKQNALRYKNMFINEILCEDVESYPLGGCIEDYDIYNENTV